LLSIRLRRVKSATSSGLDATPVSFRLSQSPLAAFRLRQAPTSIALSRYRVSFWSVGPGWSFRSFHCFPSSRFNLADPSVSDVGLTTLLSIACAGVARPRPRSARYPSPSGWESTPWPPSILRQAPTVESKRSPSQVSKPAFSPACCRLSSRRYSISVVRLSPHGCQGHVGQVMPLAAPHAACSGLQATPADFAQQSILTAYRPASGTPTNSAFSGIDSAFASSTVD